MPGRAGMALTVNGRSKLAAPTAPPPETSKWAVPVLGALGSTMTGTWTGSTLSPGGASTPAVLVHSKELCPAPGVQDHEFCPSPPPLGFPAVAIIPTGR